MTRDEAKHRLDLARDGRFGSSSRSAMMDVIDKIYDSFEIKQKPKRKTKAVAVVDNSALNVAKYLYDKILTINPTFKEPNLNQWAKDIELCIRIDKRTVNQLVECINWIYSKEGEFWQKNILSGKKLREKFDTMNMQVITKTHTKQELKLSEEAQVWANVYRKQGMSEELIIEKLREAEYIA